MANELLSRTSAPGISARTASEPLVRVRSDRLDGPSSAFFGHLVGGNRNNGIFAGWDASSGSLRLNSDRLGMWPLYYAIGPGFAASSPSVLGLLDAGADRTIDLDALSVFVRLGYFLGEDTAFKSIRALPPSASVKWTSAGGVHVESSRPPVHLLTLSRPEAVARCIDLFRQAMVRCMPHHPFILPLSGGRDSRHILFELHRQKRLPELCVTTSFYGNRADSDIRIAPILARAVGAPWKAVKPQRFEFAAEICKNEITGFCTDEHGWALGLSDFIAAQQTGTIFDGLAGDTLFVCQYQTDTVLSAYRAGRLEEVADEIFGKWSLSEQWLKHVLRPDFYRKLSIERARARLLRELAHYVDHPTPVVAFYFWNRTRREIALYTFRLIPRSVTALCPYLDPDMIDFLLSLPGELILDKAFHDECISTAFPAFAEIPFENKFARTVGRGLYWRYVAACHAAYSLAKLKSSRFVNQPRILPWLARATVTGNTGNAHLLAGRGPSMLIFLTQLEANVGP
jgi:asparagine synthase (glutamine-hydrolysing)